MGIVTIFTWLNIVAIISHPYKMTAATVQGQLLFEGSIYCSVIIIAMATIQN